MANGAFNFKDNSGNIVSYISGSGSDIIISGGTLDLSGMSGLSLGNITMEGTAETASFAPSYLLTSSFDSYTGTTNTIIGSLQTSTGSLNSFTSSTDSRLDTIEGVTGSYATTGSNTFNGNLTVTGYIDAQELRTTYISSSILYRSGSTKFGDELTDTHAFTGSLNVSGSINSVGPITVNTGTSNTDGEGIRLNRPSTGTNYHSLEFATDGTVDWSIGQNINDAFEVYENGSALTTRFTILEGGNTGIDITPTNKLHVNGGLTIESTGIIKGSNDTTDNLRFYNTDGNYSYIRQTSASNFNTVWFDGTLGSVMWYAWDNPGELRTANTYTTHRFGMGRGTSNESLQILRGGITSIDSNGATAYQISNSGITYFNGGSVGIGVNNPNAKLEVNGNIYTTSNTNFLLFGTNAAVNPYIQGGSDNSMYLGTGNSAKITISSTGTSTFSGIINANLAASAANGSININNSDPTIRFRRTAGTADKSIYELRAIAAGGVNDYFQLRLWNDTETVATELLGITSTGVANFSGNINVNSDGITIDRTTSGEAYIFFKKNGTTRASIYGGNNEEGLRFFSTKSDFSGDILLSKGTDPKIYAGSGVGLNIDGEALYLNRYTSSSISMVEGGGNIGVGTGSYEFKITSSDYDGFERVTMSGSVQPTVKFAGSDRFNLTTTNFYGGLRTQSSRWRYMRIEADIKSSNADHFGFFWSSNNANTIGIGDSNVGYKWVFQPSSNSINIRDINSNTDLQNSSTLPFDEKDGNWHHYVTEISHDGRVKIWVDGVLYHSIYGYNPGAGYCGIHTYTGTIEVSNFKITSLETQVQDVAFLAYHNSGDVNYTPSQILPYQNELFDYGGGYNTNGTFTAPVAGMYLFSATCNADVRDPYASTVPRAYWQINGANVGNHIHFRGNDLAGAATSGLTQRSATVVFYLNYGDTVRIQVQQGQWDLFGANHFCGYLLK